MPRLLNFSDLHNDSRALETLMDIEADYYFAAGDLVKLGSGIDKMAEPMKRRAKSVYVLPGNHESERDIAGSAIATDSSIFTGRCDPATRISLG
jgi:Icc-related predicted phosphoesterase